MKIAIIILSVIVCISTVFQESIKRTLLDIITDQSYLQDKVKERFLYSCCYRAPLSEYVEMDKKSSTVVRNAVEEQFPLLFEQDMSSLRRGFIELYSRLAPPDVAVKWLSGILATYHDRLSKQEAVIIRKKIKLLQFLTENG